MYKVIIDWSDTDVFDDLNNPIDIRTFETEKEADAFIYGFESGNGYISQPNLTLKEEK
tara:strand:- start:320 stop:493 length:174 start_codon:yes stop_codon:yes gene_type:complete